MPERRVLAANPETGTCTARELAPLIDALDQAFVSGRGREGSLVHRYPGLLSDSNLGQIHVRRHAGRIVACCAVRRFTWLDGDTRWAGAMIGMVHTAPACRGRGHAAAVLEATLDALAGAGVDFAVLWSGLDGFYERLGWTAHDRGVFGSVAASPAPQGAAAPTRLGSVDIRRFEALRERHAPRRVARGPDDYRAVPLPAERVVGAFAGEGEPLAAALVGHAGTTRYVFDVVGEAAALPGLWQAISAGAALVHVNEVIGSEFHRWLARNVEITFTAQDLAHWRMLSPRAIRAPWRDWHLPWFDRI